MTTGRIVPNGWAIATVGEIATYQNGRAFKPSEWKTTGLPIVRIQNLNTGTAAFNFSDIRHETRFKLKHGDLLFAWSASLGAHIWRGQDAWLNQHIFRVDHAKQLDRRFLYHTLTDITNALYTKAHGSGMVHVTKGSFEETEIGLPPLNEQRRIAAKIDELFSELDKSVESLETARVQLGTYRQAVLKHAFEGELTAPWREQNRDKLETPDQLLARIQREREVRYAQQLEQWKAAVKMWKESDKASKRPVRPRRLKELSPLSRAETKDLPSLASGWLYVRLGLVIDEPKYGTSKKCEYNHEGTGVLRIPNVVRGVVDTSDLKGAEFGEDEKRAYALRKGDVLVIRSNGSISIVGKSALVSKADEQYLFAGYLIRLRSNPAVLLADYLATLLPSHLLRTQIEHTAKSTSGVNNINSGEIQSFVGPLCSTSEQAVLVEQLSAGLSVIDVIEMEIDRQLLKADALRRSILKKAFAGQLTPQDPHDEPASVLLDRIRAERARTARKRSHWRTSGGAPTT